MRRAFLPGLLLAALAWSSAHGSQDASPAQPAAPAAFNRQWTVAELLPAVAELGAGRSWIEGGRVFQQAGCGICHSFSKYWEGNGLAPDLTPVGTKYSRDFILESILEPSASINPQYYHTEFKLKEGSVIRGSIISSAQGRLTVAPVMMTPDVTIEIAKADIQSEGPSPVSPMPAGMLNGFTKEQIVELMAFLDAGGNPDAAVYRR